MRPNAPIDWTSKRQYKLDYIYEPIIFTVGNYNHL